MRTDDFDFELPDGLIAQQPLERRDRCRLMVLRRAGGIDHRTFHDLPDLLRPGDLLILNDTRVIPARFFARRASGGRIEGLFLTEPATGTWEVLLKGADRCKVGEILTLGATPKQSEAELGGADSDTPKQKALGNGTDDVALRLVENCGQGQWRLAVEPAMPAVEVLAKSGQTPLPPYIRRSMAANNGRHATLANIAANSGGSTGLAEIRHATQDELDRGAYQTVYAARPGAVAAPTAGLHFTPELLKSLATKGIGHAFVTLHVGMGTFWPVKVDDLKDHRMHSEWYDLPQATADAINAAKRDGRRIVAVGTTVVRVLESAANAVGPETGLQQSSGWTDIFIYPPCNFRVIDALITNFHLPRSTLLMLVSAFCSPGSADGIAAIKDAYRQAAAMEYRFFSYGDAMLIE